MKVLLRADTHVSFKLNDDAPKPKCTLSQVITALSVSLVSLIVGFVSAYTSPAEETLRSEVGINKEQYSWVCGLMPLGALIGGLVGGQLIELTGRKTTISITNVLFVVSWAMVALATNVWYLYAARSISGFCVGIASLALPVYLGETVQPEVRGTLGLLPTAFGNIGILMCFTIGSYVKWNQLAWVGICLPVPFLFLMFIIPETPRWYVAKGKHEQARTALQWLRGKDANVKAEYEELEKSQKESDESSSSSNLGELFNRVHLKPLLISLGLMFFQQMSGINAVIFYTTSIFEMAGSTINKNLCTIIVGIVNFVSTFIATVLIDRLGRKVLLYVSSVSMTITLACLGTYFHLSKNGVDVSNYGWLPLVSFVVYVLGFSLGFGPIPWLMLGEILPAKIRGSAAALATAFNWTCTFIVTKTFVDIISLIGPDGTFWLFAVICTISLIFVIMWVPETQGQSLQDIERKLAGFKVRRMSSKANMKPLPSTF
ncbi:facilitated trehalose transporter Tret1-like isoform X2 [Agrilus planipennis]|uniref:Facilitated trehalose transporter Tret1-like isoform X2 n=1 Tax=Agrilus planipennis TaxID=224129 RepID=A0A1W4X116_AGRPL|nr:facilitated trehalose transporter Tret1-like isoform X2 [Agrilus planipennis]